jgi:hypothetical protein
MAVAAVKSQNEQKKMIIAIALGVLALIALWWTFFGFGGGSSKPQPQSQQRGTPLAKSSPVPGKVPDPPVLPGPAAVTPNDLTVLPVSWQQPRVPEPGRNIFAFYVKPPPSPTPTAPPQTPTPTPTPPVLLASVSPSNVYARTDDFMLEVTGDKFTSGFRIVFDNRELPTRYLSPQQMSTTVPAAMISNSGPRPVLVRSSDGKFYSNSVMVNVQAPPVPNYTYVGIIAKPGHIGDTALLQDKNSKEISSQQRGDIVGGKFRITSISVGELVLVDTSLKIKHTLALTIDGGKSAFPQGRPTPKVASEDDEPQ